MGLAAHDACAEADGARAPGPVPASTTAAIATAAAEPGNGGHDDVAPASMDPIAGDPFAALPALASHETLLAHMARAPCPDCGQSRQHFCYDCCVPCGAVRRRRRPRRHARSAGRLTAAGAAGVQPPRITLPMDVAIVKHPLERNGKSTATHAKLLAPDHVRIYAYPGLPPWINEEPQAECIVIYPRPGAPRLSELSDAFAHCSRVIFIDGTWTQAACIAADDRLARLPFVQLNADLGADRPLVTRFWRTQARHGPDHLSTVEAIYWFFVQWRQRFPPPPADADAADAPRAGGDGGYRDLDNLLWYFAFQWRRIQHLYRTTPRLRDNPTLKLNQIHFIRRRRATSSGDHDGNAGGDCGSDAHDSDASKRANLHTSTR